MGLSVFGSTFIIHAEHTLAFSPSLCFPFDFEILSGLPSNIHIIGCGLSQSFVLSMGFEGSPGRPYLYYSF